MKFIEESVMCTEKHVLVNKCLQIGLNMDLPRRVSVEKKVHGVEKRRFSSK